MRVLYNKTALCYIGISDFTDIQGIDSNPMYKRFDSVKSVIKGIIDEEYHSFLAQPVLSDDEDIITWYTTDWNEVPKRLLDLPEEERRRYELIKEQTLNHYQKALEDLNFSERKILSNALKYCVDDYVYCFDNKVVLAVWGMKLRDSIIKPIGEIVHEFSDSKSFKITFNLAPEATSVHKNDLEIRRKEGYILSKDDIPQIELKDEYKFISWNPNPIDHKVIQDVSFDAIYEKDDKYTVIFDAGEHGILNGVNEIHVLSGKILLKSDIPTIEPNLTYGFLGWNPYNPMGHTITENIVFTAQYQKEKLNQTPEIISSNDFVNIRFDAGEHGILHGEDFNTKERNTIITQEDIPSVKANKGYKFVGWDKEPLNYRLAGDVVFSAKYDKNLPWYKRIWTWFLGLKGFWGNLLKWLFYLLLLLLLLFFLSLIFRSCHSCSGTQNGDTILSINGNNDKNSRIINDGAELVPIIPSTPFVPLIIDDRGNLPPIVQNPGAPDIIANRLNIYFEDNNVDLNQFAQDFKQIYPDSKYKIIGCDARAFWMQIQIPEEERIQIKNEINSKLNSYNFFVIDESLFEGAFGKSGYVNKKGADPGWHLKAVNAYKGWLITKGNTDVIVAVIDDGLDLSHELMRDKIVKPYDVFTQTETLTVGKGHGTHVAGIAVGQSNLDIGVSGIAPNCMLMPVQVFNEGICPFSALVNGILYAIHEGADVVNVSIVTPFKGLDILSEKDQMEIINTRFKAEEWAWNKIINIANKKNTILVFAAGNDRVITNLPPEHRTSKSVNVAAVNKKLAITDFSNYGVGSIISAPGVDIYSSFPVNDYGYFDGTSMAAPIVSGTIALMKSLKKDLTVEQITEIFIRTGKIEIDKNIPIIQVDKVLEMVKSGNIPENSEKDEMTQIELPQSKGQDYETDYDAIRRLIEEYKNKIIELERLLPEYQQ
jgi:subtilisin family serine protease